MLTMTADARIAGIVAELARLLADRQTLVHRLDAVTSTCPEQRPGRCPGQDATAHRELAAQLGQVIAHQTRLLDELTALYPPAGRAHP
jgi:hypothetical protein